MYLHLYQQMSPGDKAKIICDKRSAAELVYALAKALSTSGEEEINLVCKDFVDYWLTIKIDNSIINNPDVKLPYLCEPKKNAGLTEEYQTNDVIGNDVNNTLVEVDNPNEENVFYEEVSDTTSEIPF